MDRRAFLVGSALSMGVAAVARPAHGFAEDRTPRVLRLDSDQQLWRPFSLAADASPQIASRRLRLLGPHLAASSRLRELELDLVSAAPSPAPARHRAWRFVSARAHGNSGSSSIALPAQGVTMQLRLSRADSAQPEHLHLDPSRWPEGDYLVRLDAADATVMDCGPYAACAPPQGVDGFLMQVRLEQDTPDLCLRADLACLAQDAASV